MCAFNSLMLCDHVVSAVLIEQYSNFSQIPWRCQQCDTYQGAFSTQMHRDKKCHCKFNGITNYGRARTGGRVPESGKCGLECEPEAQGSDTVILSQYQQYFHCIFFSSKGLEVQYSMTMWYEHPCQTKTSRSCRTAEEKVHHLVQVEPGLNLASTLCDSKRWDNEWLGEIPSTTYKIHFPQPWSWTYRKIIFNFFTKQWQSVP